MTALWPQATLTYPSSDGEPVAETYAHLYALLITLEVLRQQAEQRAAAAEQRAAAAEQALESLRKRLRDRGINPDDLIG